MRAARLSWHSGRPVTATEGGHAAGTQTRIEHDSRLRAACIAAYGTHCQVGGIDFGEACGPAAHGLVHVRHLHPLAEGVRTTNALNVLRPVCPNCHMVLHAGGTFRSIADVVQLREAALRRARA